MIDHLYLSGPMAGRPLHNFPAFETARLALRECGYRITCPAELGVVDGWNWADYLRRDLRVLLDCAAVAVLDGWRHSRGARLEVHVARELGLPVEPVAHWLDCGSVSPITHIGVSAT